MLQTTGKELLQSCFKECVLDLNKNYPFCISNEIFRKAMNTCISKKVYSDLVAVINESIDKEIDEGLEFIKDNGFTVKNLRKVNFYPPMATSQFTLEMTDKQWRNVLKIASSCGLVVEKWRGKRVLSLIASGDVSKDLAPSSVEYADVLDEFLSKQEKVYFYGGELFLKQSEEGNKFFYSSFTLSRSNKEIIKYYQYVDDIFNRTQLEFYAKERGKKIKRGVYADALATIEMLIIK